MPHLKQLVFMAFVAFASIAPASAQEPGQVILDASEQIVITGYIEEILYNTFTISPDYDVEPGAGPAVIPGAGLQRDDPGDDRPITVTLNNFNVDFYNTIDSLLSEGMRVAVHGRLVNGNTIEAERIVHLR